MKPSSVRVAGVAATLALALAACAPGEQGEQADPATPPAEEPAPTAEEELSPLGLPVIDPLEVDPNVDVLMAGSSTVFPLSTAIVERWIDEGGPAYTVDSIGSGGGLARFCVERGSDIANASRPINEEERAACEEGGREPIELRIGSDAVAFVVSQDNYFAQELTLEELATAFSLTEPGSTWADVNPEFPPHPIQLFTPGADSGTFDFVTEELFPEEDEADLPSPILGSIAEVVGEDDHLTARGVAGDGCTEGDTSTTCAIGYFGFAFFQANADVLRAVTIDGVAPTAETVHDGSYVLARPLFLYTAASVIEEKPQVAEFLAFYLNNVNDVIDDVGYFPAPDEALQEAADTLKQVAGW